MDGNRSLVNILRSAVVSDDGRAALDAEPPVWEGWYPENTSDDSVPEGESLDGITSPRDDLPLLEAASLTLRETRADVRQHSTNAYFAALALGITSGIAVVVGIGLALAGLLPAGASAAVGALGGSVGFRHFWNLYHDERKRLDRLITDLRLIEHTRVGLMIANQISDPTARDEALQQIIGRITGPTEVVEA